MSGAAYLCALAAYRAGAGLVKILTVEENREILHQLLPEAILSVYDADADPEALREQVRQECAWADVIAAGPGLGTSESSRILIRELLECAYVPVILDADALNILAAEPELTRYLTENMIVTPHLGEMARLTGCSVGSIQEHLRETALQFAREHGVCCVLKDAVTLAAGRTDSCLSIPAATAVWPRRDPATCWQEPLPGCWPREWSPGTRRRWGCTSTDWRETGTGNKEAPTACWPENWQKNWREVMKDAL